MKLFNGQRANSNSPSLRQSPKLINITLIIVGALYWFLFSISSGMIQYYRYSLSDVLSKTIGNKPVFIYYHNISYFLMYGGIYWFPTYHIGITLPLMQFTLSVFLAIMVSLVVGDTIKIKRSNVLKKENRISIGGSLISLITTTGGCCSLPFIYYLLSFVTTASTSFGATLFFVSHSYLIDAFIILILVVLHLRNRKLNQNHSQDSNITLN